MGRLEGKVGIVTGAAQALGEALAHRLGKEGTNVVVADIHAAGAENVAAEIHQESGVRTLAVACDVTDESQVEVMVRRAEEEFSCIDILVANAGIIHTEATVDFPVDKWRKVIDVNLLGYFLCAKHVLRVMVRQHSGVIIQINSKSGKRGSVWNTAYAASKFGGIGLTQSLALEFAEQGIRVNAICSGNLLDSPLWTEQIYERYAKKWGISPEEVRQRYVDQVPMKRGCTYEDVANVMVFLASDESCYMTGQAINVTGGQIME